MPNNVGFSFQPGSQSNTMMGGRQPNAPLSQPSAVEIKSLSLPNRNIPNSIAPQSLMQAPGAAGAGVGLAQLLPLLMAAFAPKANGLGPMQAGMGAPFQGAQSPQGSPFAPMAEQRANPVFSGYQPPVESPFQGQQAQGPMDVPLQRRNFDPNVKFQFPGQEGSLGAVPGNPGTPMSPPDNNFIDRSNPQPSAGTGDARSLFDGSGDTMRGWMANEKLLRNGYGQGYMGNLG